MNPPPSDTDTVDTPFTRLLSRLACQAPDWPVFNEGYQQTLHSVQEGGRFAFQGMTLDAPAGVYPPKPGSSTEFVVTHWESAGLLEARGALLEVGTGSGALALYAARHGWQVMAGDIDALAVDTARNNARANGISLEVFQTDLFSAVQGLKFDAILFNFPLYHKDTVTWGEHTLSDANGALSQRFFDEAKSHLNADGCVVFVYANCSRGDLLDRSDWQFEIVGCDYFAIGRYWRALVKARPRP